VLLDSLHSPLLALAVPSFTHLLFCPPPGIPGPPPHCDARRRLAPLPHVPSLIPSSSVYLIYIYSIYYVYINTYITSISRYIPHLPSRGEWREIESRFQVRFPRIDFDCQRARFFLLALIIILTLYSHGFRQMPRST